MTSKFGVRWFLASVWHKNSAAQSRAAACMDESSLLPLHFFFGGKGKGEGEAAEG